MTCLRLSRRALLRGAGGIAVGLPMLEIMTGRKASAAAGTSPRRLIIFFSPNGTNDMTQFMPQDTGAGFVLGSETSPLEPLRDRLLVLSNIRMDSAKFVERADLHSTGMSCVLTGTPWGGPAEGYEMVEGTEHGFAGGISIDQYLGKRIGAATKFPTLEFGVQTVSDYGVHPLSRMCSAGLNQPVPAEDDPALMFERVFTDGSSVAGQTMEQTVAQRRSILDHVKGDFDRLLPRLGAKDRQKLDAHLTAVRNLEMRLARTPSGASCALPASFATVGDPLDKNNFPVVGKQQMDLLTLALQCDVTRVASLQWSWARSLLSFPWIGVNESHHGLSHAGASPQLSSINNWFAQQLAYLASSLLSQTEADGTSVLDNTVIWWCSDVAVGQNHAFDNMRVFLLGSCGGALKTGEHISYENGEPQNKLLVSLLNAMGVADNQFGDPKYEAGPLPGVAAV